MVLVCLSRSRNLLYWRRISSHSIPLEMHFQPTQEFDSPINLLSFTQFHNSISFPRFFFLLLLWKPFSLLSTVSISNQMDQVHVFALYRQPRAFASWYRFYPFCLIFVCVCFFSIIFFICGGNGTQKKRSVRSRSSSLFYFIFFLI